MSLLEISLYMKPWWSPFIFRLVCLARALFDYDGQNDEELSFEEGAIINILRKDDGEVDDGWWEGELNGHIGVFPSLLVEDVANEDDADYMDGGDQQPQMDGGQQAQQSYETTVTYSEESSYTSGSTSNNYNSEEARTSNLYGTMPRSTAEKRHQEPSVCDSLDLTVPRATPVRPRLPQHLLRQSMEENHSYERNEYV